MNPLEPSSLSRALPPLEENAVSAIGDLFRRQQAAFASGVTQTYGFRMDMLRRFEQALCERGDALEAALYADLRKSQAESYLSEMAVLRHELALTTRNLMKWMRPKRVPTPVHLQPGRSRIYPQPLGCALIIGPWNYPVQLTLGPLIGALAAGNCVVIKPSELAPATSKAVRDLVVRTFDPSVVGVVEGGIEPTQALLAMKFDHIFFTGSTTVGKIVYEAAAKNLVPVTLELGGKSPVIVTDGADLDLAATRIAWGKFLNAGQTCVAPDYLLVQERLKDSLLDKIKGKIGEFFGQDPIRSHDFGRIINARNFSRLEKLMTSGQIAMGGRRNAEQLYIEPTLMTGVGWQDPIMREEIFGPILPVLTFKSWEEAMEKIRRGEKPLAAYLFGGSPAQEEEFCRRLSFGGGCINDTLVHLTNPHLPFGGVGASGIGSYHGYRSFEVFSHFKSVVHKSRWFDPWFRYPPFNGSKFNWLKRFV